MSEEIGIVVADDHEVVRAGFAALLDTQPDFTVLGTASDGAEAVLDALTSSGEYAVDLRRASPFAGILTERERRSVLESFAESRRNRARTMGPEKRERALHGV